MMKAIFGRMSAAMGILAAGFLFVGCNGNSNNSSGATTGNIQIVVTDSPFPFSSVAQALITVTDVNVHAVGGGGFTGYQMAAPKTIDLVQLNNGVTNILQTIALAPGQYDQVRLILSTVTVKLQNGTVYSSDASLSSDHQSDINLGSSASSGIKIFIKPEPILVSAGVTTEALLDFDLANTFNAQYSNSNQITGFTFNPVIRATNQTSTGSISGNVTNAISSAVVANAEVTITCDPTNTAPGCYVLNSNGDATSTPATWHAFTDANGNYMVMGLLVGLYDVSFSYGSYSSPSPAQVMVATGGSNYTANGTVQ